MGKKIFYPLLNIGCFLGGVSVCLSIFDTTLAAIHGGLVIVIIFALMTKFLYKTSLALSGGALGFLIAFLSINSIPRISSPYNYIICIAAALLLAILFVAKSNFFIILSTSLTGASLLGTIVIFLCQNITNLSNYVYVDGFLSTALHLTKYLTNSYSVQNDLTYTIVTMFIFIVGVIIQAREEKYAK